jgi:hypothetical protein
MNLNFSHAHFVTESAKFKRCQYNALCFSCNLVVHDMSFDSAPLCNFCFLQMIKQNFPERTAMIEHFEALIDNPKYDTVKELLNVSHQTND